MTVKTRSEIFVGISNLKFEKYGIRFNVGVPDSYAADNILFYFVPYSEIVFIIDNKKF